MTDCDLCGDEIGEGGVHGHEVQHEDTGEVAFANLCGKHYDRLQAYNRGEVDSVLGETA